MHIMLMSIVSFLLFGLFCCGFAIWLAVPLLADFEMDTMEQLARFVFGAFVAVLGGLLIWLGISMLNFI